ncbi:Alpha/Beta hydrolase protein [Mycena epipterygia]|nr:Alpha/Beta hydrolase protein [Mycena epipterygia]
MRVSNLSCLFAVAFAVTLVDASSNSVDSFKLKPFSIGLTSEIRRLKALARNIRLPATACYPDAGPDKDIELDFLDELWIDGYKTWTGKRSNHYTVVIEGQTVPLIPEKSTNPNAIPVILLHGWPEFLPIIKPLTETSKNVSYNVVVPSLPGFVFSSAPPINWTVDDTACIFNTLMTEVLGYLTYTVHSTDWV